MVSAMVWVRFEPGSALRGVGPIPANANLRLTC
jgi:hypothetical protein